MGEKGGWVYIMTNQPNGVLYVGVTAELMKRVWDHREGNVDGFTKKYGLKMLVWFERHDTILGAIRREKAIKGWARRWKVQLITKENFEWVDLYGALL